MLVSWRKSSQLPSPGAGPCGARGSDHSWAWAWAWPCLLGAGSALGQGLTEPSLLPVPHAGCVRGSVQGPHPDLPEPLCWKGGTDMPQAVPTTASLGTNTEPARPPQPATPSPAAPTLWPHSHHQAATPVTDLADKHATGPHVPTLSIVAPLHHGLPQPLGAPTVLGGQWPTQQCRAGGRRLGGGTGADRQVSVSEVHTAGSEWWWGAGAGGGGPI